jgi:nitrate/nitrite transporter NarK
VISIAVAAVLLVLSAVAPGNVAKFVCLCLAAAAIFSAQPIFWTMPSRFLHGATAAAALATINSIGNMGGFVAQNVVPIIRDATGSNLAPMFFLAACISVSGVMFVFMERLIARVTPK